MPMLAKLLVLLLLLTVIINLGFALRALVSPAAKRPVSRYLGLRLAFSLSQLLVLLLMWAMGWLVPHTLPTI